MEWYTHQRRLDRYVPRWIWVGSDPDDACSRSWMKPEGPKKEGDTAIRSYSDRATLRTSDKTRLDLVPRSQSPPSFSEPRGSHSNSHSSSCHCLFFFARRRPSRRSQLQATTMPSIASDYTRRHLNKFDRSPGPIASTLSFQNSNVSRVYKT